VGTIILSTFKGVLGGSSFVFNMVTCKVSSTLQAKV